MARTPRVAVFPAGAIICRQSAEIIRQPPAVVKAIVVQLISDRRPSVLTGFTIRHQHNITALAAVFYAVDGRLRRIQIAAGHGCAVINGNAVQQAADAAAGGVAALNCIINARHTGHSNHRPIEFIVVAADNGFQRSFGCPQPRAAAGHSAAHRVGRIKHKQKIRLGRIIVHKTRPARLHTERPLRKRRSRRRRPSRQRKSRTQARNQAVQLIQPHHKRQVIHFPNDHIFLFFFQREIM